MPNSLPDVVLKKYEWTNLHERAGLAAGAALNFRNKTGAELLVFESPTQPADGAIDGDLVQDRERTAIGAGSPGCWVYSKIDGGRVFVQAGA